MTVRGLLFSPKECHPGVSGGQENSRAVQELDPDQIAPGELGRKLQDELDGGNATRLKILLAALVVFCLLLPFSAVRY